MRSLAFHRNHFTAGPVLLDYDGADIAESYHLAFVGGTEENVKGGVLFRREADTLPTRVKSAWATARPSRWHFCCCRSRPRSRASG